VHVREKVFEPPEIAPPRRIQGRAQKAKKEEAVICVARVQHVDDQKIAAADKDQMDMALLIVDLEGRQRSENVRWTEKGGEDPRRQIEAIAATREIRIELECDRSVNWELGPK
jgi:hypothetical protein